MSLNLRRAFRFARSWLRECADLVVLERMISTDEGPRPATLLMPAAPRAPLPAWILLHGITRPGRAHPMLVRFARALASSGAAVLVPEVPEWVALTLAPDRTLPTVRAGLDALAREPGVAGGPVGLVGFSFGAPQALRASAHPELAPRLAGAVAYGGYSDLERTVRFQLSGVHEWDGRTMRLRPDPYGRWIVAGNYLHRIPGFEDAAQVSAALLELARISGEARTPAWDPVYDPAKDRLRGALSADHRALFDRFAPPSAADPPADSVEVQDWAERLADAARRRDPLIDALADVRALPRPVHILHGREDRLIPYSEGLRLGERLASRGAVRTTLTGLFAHSTEHPWRAVPGRLGEGAAFTAALARVLGMV